VIAERRRTSTATPVYEFSLKQRAAIQLLTNSIEHVASQMLALETAPQREANCHAAQILWQCRELVLLAAERRVPR
jgi:hypothetical protein